MAVIENAGSSTHFLIKSKVAQQLIEDEGSYALVASLVTTQAQVFVEALANDGTSKTVHFKGLFVACELAKIPQKWSLFSNLANRLSSKEVKRTVKHIALSSTMSKQLDAATSFLKALFDSSLFEFELFYL